MFENTWESAYLKHSASIPCFFRMGPLHRLNSLDLNAMTYVDVGLCMFVPLAGTGEVLIGFELLHSKFRADLPAIHMWPVPEDALPAIGIVTRQGPPKSKAQSDGDSNFNNFVLLQEGVWPKAALLKVEEGNTSFHPAPCHAWSMWRTLLRTFHGFTIRWKIMLAIPLTYLLRYGLRDLISSGRTEDPLVNVRVAWWQSACR